MVVMYMQSCMFAYTLLKYAYVLLKKMACPSKGLIDDFFFTWKIFESANFVKNIYEFSK